VESHYINIFILDYGLLSHQEGSSELLQIVAIGLKHEE